MAAHLCWMTTALYKVCKSICFSVYVKSNGMFHVGAGVFVDQLYLPSILLLQASTTNFMRLSRAASLITTLGIPTTSPHLL